MRRYAVCIWLCVAFVLTTGSVLADPALPLRRMPISGDQDGSETPLQFNAPTLELLRDVQHFRVPGEGPQVLTFDVVYREASYLNEFGYFKVDDLQGRINGILPGEPGYIQAAVGRSTVVFASGATAYTADVAVSLNGGDILIFFLVQNSTLDRLKQFNPLNQLSRSPIAFFSFDQLNPDGVDHFVGFRSTAAPLTQFGFEDLTNGGDRDYDDIVYTIGVTLQPSPTVATRDVVFIRGFDSVGQCDRANEWVRAYLQAQQGKGLYRTLHIGKYLNFNYAGGGSYDCPRPGEEPAYTGIDTCDGVVQAAGELKELIDRSSSQKVSVVAHSMGGLVAAYMVAANKQWAKQRVASVITFDSPLKGVKATLAALRTLLPPCADTDPALPDVREGSVATIVASEAATIVPFYPLDAIGTIDDSIFPRSHVRLDSARPFTISSWCGVNAFEPNCTPPTPVRDDHGSLWNERTSYPYLDGLNLYKVDKAPLVACGVAAAFDCTTIGPASAGSQLVHVAQAAGSYQVQVPPRAGRIQFVASFSRPVQMVITAPNGAVYGPAGAGPVAGYAVDATSEVYQITDATAGTWTVVVQGDPEAVAQAELAFSVLELAAPPAPLAPVAVGDGPYFVRIGEKVLLTAANSYDPDGVIVGYEWDFDGDGRFDAQSQRPEIEHTYREVFVGTAVVRVTDDARRSATSTIEVHAGYVTLLPVVQR